MIGIEGLCQAISGLQCGYKLLIFWERIQQQQVPSLWRTPRKPSDPARNEAIGVQPWQDHPATSASPRSEASPCVLATLHRMFRRYRGECGDQTVDLPPARILPSAARRVRTRRSPSCDRARRRTDRPRRRQVRELAQEIHRYLSRQHHRSSTTLAAHRGRLDLKRSATVVMMRSGVRRRARD